MIRRLDVGEDGQLDFTVLHEGASGPLTIMIKVEEADAPDLHFLGAPALVADIRLETETFSGGRKP